MSPSRDSPGINSSIEGFAYFLVTVQTNAMKYVDPLPRARRNSLSKVKQPEPPTSLTIV